MQVTLRIRLTPQLDLDKLRKYFMANKRLFPVYFGIEVDYAERLEYGCGPMKLIKGADKNALIRDLTNWATKKKGSPNSPIQLPITNKKQAKQFAESIAERMWEKGCYPHPFYRPAMKWLSSNLQSKWNDGWSLFEIMDEVKRQCNQIIMQTNLPFEGTLQQSMIVRELLQQEIDGTEGNGRVSDPMNIDALSKMAWK